MKLQFNSYIFLIAAKQAVNTNRRSSAVHTSGKHASVHPHNIKNNAQSLRFLCFGSTEHMPTARGAKLQRLNKASSHFQDCETQRRVTDSNTTC